MRQFLLGKNVAYATGSKLTDVADGAIGVFYDNNGTLTATTTGKDVTKEAMLVLGRKDEAGPIVLPIYKNNFTYVKGSYVAATTFKATIKIENPTYVGDYSLIVVKKGIKFNERNKWTATVHVKDTTTLGDELATDLAEQINNNGSNSGVKATVTGSTITIESLVAGVDYNVVPADLLYGTKVTIVTKGMQAYGDANYIADLADKAAADAGFEYTFRDAYVDLYPNYPLNALAQPNATDTGFTIFTLRFVEPRQVKTRDEVVNQIVQVAFPTGASAIASFETVCKGLSGIEDAATVEE